MAIVAPNKGPPAGRDDIWRHACEGNNFHFLEVLELGTDSYTEVVPAPQGGRLW
jgi:hypothetical protein